MLRVSTLRCATWADVAGCSALVTGCNRWSTRRLYSRLGLFNDYRVTRAWLQQRWTKTLAAGACARPTLSAKALGVAIAVNGGTALVYSARVLNAYAAKVPAGQAE